MEKGKSSKANLASFNHNFFEVIDTEEKAYWLGFIMADGCVSITHSPKVLLGVAEKDAEHIREFHYVLNSSIKYLERKWEVCYSEL